MLILSKVSRPIAMLSAGYNIYIFKGSDGGLIVISCNLAVILDSISSIYLLYSVFIVSIYLLYTIFSASICLRCSSFCLRCAAFSSSTSS